jgi:hypothetical protein
MKNLFDFFEMIVFLNYSFANNLILKNIVGFNILKSYIKI